MSNATLHGRRGYVLQTAAFLLLCLLVAFMVYAALNAWKSAQPSTFPSRSAPAPSAAKAISSADIAKLDTVLNTIESLRNQGENAKAEAILKQAIAEHADEQRLYIQYAEVLTAQKKLPAAYDQYVKALAVGPRDAGLELAAGTLASMTNQLEHAVEHYSAAQTANKTDYRAPLFLAQVLLKLDRVDEAKKNLLLAAELKPEAAVAWGTLADLAMRENKPSVALNYIARARELEPNVTTWRVVHARALKRQGESEQALQLLIGLNEAQKREKGVMPLIAECLGALSRPMDAAEMYAAASTSEPSRGDWAMEAALWYERAKEPKRGVPFAERAADLKVEGAKALAARLGK